MKDIYKTVGIAAVYVLVGATGFVCGAWLTNAMFALP